MKNIIANNEFDTILQLIDLINQVTKEQKQREKESPGTLNLYDLNRISHFENYHSNILAYLLDGNQKHRHPEFGELFIKYVNDECLCNSLPAYSRCSIVREKATDKGRRIDIFLETDTFCFIIENKIYAKDQDRQLIDYYSWALRHYQNKQVYLCYLTLDGSSPSEYSISSKELEELHRDITYFSLSYSKDILAWLQSLQTRPGERVLESALLQYIDLLQGLCLQREENFMELRSIVNTMGNMCSHASQTELSQYLRSTRLLIMSCNYYIFRNFLLELGKKLVVESQARNYSYSVCLTHHQERFAIENLEGWEHSLSSDFEDIGLELSLGDSVGIGFELDSFFQKTTLSFGIMLHGKQYEYPYHMNPTWEAEGNDGFSIYRDKSEWWKESINVSYILEKLYSDQSTELDINYIVNWVIDEWRYNINYHN